MLNGQDQGYAYALPSHLEALVCLLTPGSAVPQDPYANFVIQTALSVTSGQLHASLVEAIRPYLPSLRGTPFGKARTSF